MKAALRSSPKYSTSSDWSARARSEFVVKLIAFTPWSKANASLRSEAIEHG